MLKRGAKRTGIAVLATVVTGCCAVTAEVAGADGHAAPAGTDAVPVVAVGAERKQRMTYGMDFERLWYWGGLKPEAKRKLARLALVECPVAYVRVAINGAAEIEEGKIDWGAYAKILDCMRTLRAARPDIEFFASPRPFHEAVKGSPYTCYPLWITRYEKHPTKDKMKFKEFLPEKAAGYLARYVKFMKSQGFTITYIDSKNECRNMRPAALAKMARLMKEQLGDDMPIVIAPSSYDYGQAAAWLREAIDGGCADFFGIVSSHNTKTRGSREDLVALARSLGLSVWNTELHSFTGPDENAAAKTKMLFDHIRSGFSGANDWLSLGNEKKTHKMFRNIKGDVVAMRIYYIFKKVVNVSCGGNYLHTEAPPGLASTVAFIKDRRLSVFLLNTDKERPVRLRVALDGHTPAKKTAQLTSWGPADPREGGETTLRVAGTSIACTVPADTLQCIVCEVK